MPAFFFAISAIGTAIASHGVTPGSGSRSAGTPVALSYTTVVCPLTGSSAPNLRKSSQFRATATSRAPPELSTGRVEIRTRHDDSPPRICGPKLFVRTAW